MSLPGPAFVPTVPVASSGVALWCHEDTAPVAMRMETSVRVMWPSQQPQQPQQQQQQPQQQQPQQQQGQQSLEWRVPPFAGTVTKAVSACDRASVKDTDEAVAGIAWSPRGLRLGMGRPLLAVVTTRYRVFVTGERQRNEWATLVSGADPQVKGTTSVTGAAWSPVLTSADGTVQVSLLALAAKDNTVGLWMFPSLSCQTKLGDMTLVGTVALTRQPARIAWKADGDSVGRVAVAEDQGGVLTFDVTLANKEVTLGEQQTVVAQDACHIAILQWVHMGGDAAAALVVVKHAKIHVVTPDGVLEARFAPLVCPIAVAWVHGLAALVVVDLFATARAFKINDGRLVEQPDLAHQFAEVISQQMQRRGSKHVYGFEISPMGTSALVVLCDPRTTPAQPSMNDRVAVFVDLTQFPLFAAGAKQTVLDKICQHKAALVKGSVPALLWEAQLVSADVTPFLEGSPLLHAYVAPVTAQGDIAPYVTEQLRVSLGRSLQLAADSGVTQEDQCARRISNFLSGKLEGEADECPMCVAGSVPAPLGPSLRSYCANHHQIDRCQVTLQPSFSFRSTLFCVHCVSTVIWPSAEFAWITPFWSNLLLQRIQQGCVFCGSPFEVLVAPIKPLKF